MNIGKTWREYKRRRLAKKGFASPTKKRHHNGSKPRAPSGRRGFRFVLSLLVVMLWVAATGTILYQRTYPKYTYVVGQTADRDIYSEVPFEYDDLAETQRQRQHASTQTAAVYRIERSPLEASQHLATQTIDALGELAVGDDALPFPEGRAAALIQDLKKGGFLESLQDVLQGKQNRELLKRLTRTALAQGIVKEDRLDLLKASADPSGRIYVLDVRDRRSSHAVGEVATTENAARQVAADYLAQYPATSPQQLEALQALLTPILPPNLVYDNERTMEIKDDATQSVPMAQRFVEAGIRILTRGEKIKQEDLLRLKAHEYKFQQQLRQKNSLREMLVISLITATVILVFGYAFRVMSPSSLRSRAELILIATIVILQILLTRLAIDVYYLQHSASVFLLPALPVAIGAMLLAQLNGLRVAIWAAVFTSIVAALQTGVSFQVFLCGCIASFVGAGFVWRARRRSEVFRAGFWVGVATFVANSLFFIGNEVPPNYLLHIALISFINGIATAMAASLVLPIFEYVFGIMTDISLLELSDLNHPLLQRLQIEAPGTFHHSLVVATLAEQAAASVGGNPLLARVCAYFHDIGKISQPEYFAENAMTMGKDLHSNLRPRMSSLVILNHVKEGLDLAARYKLKRVIREAIVQHHGTSLIYYFYRRALDAKAEEAGDSAIGQQDYRYPGPKPVRKEIALISIADACEAAARSLEKPTPRKVEALVNEIVMRRIEDGQLEEADLTFKELATAKTTIAKALTTIHHPRVVYPKARKHEDTAEKPDTKPAAEESAETS